MDEFSGLTPITSSDSQPIPNAPDSDSGEFAGLSVINKDQAHQVKHGTGLEQAKTIAENLASGATLGGSEIAETKLLGVKPEDIEGRRSANPWEAGLSNVAGTAALMATPFGEIGEGVGAAADALGASPLAARVAGLGVEGSLIGGTGTTADEYALGDPNLNAQKIISNYGIGLALGSGLGALSKGVEAALPAASEKLSSALENIKGKVSSIGEDAPEGSWLDSIHKGINGVDKDPVSIREMSSNIGDVYKASKEAAKDLYETAAPANIGKALESMPLQDAQEKAFGIYDQIESKVNDLKSNPEDYSSSQVKQINNKVSDLQNDLVGAKSAFEVHTALTDFAKDISKDIKFDKIPTASQQAVQQEMKGMNGLVRDSLSNADQWGEAANHYSQVNTQYNSYKTALKNFESNFMKKEVSASGTKKFIMDPSKVQSFFNNTGDVSQDLKSQYLNDFMNQSQSLSKANENYYGYKAAEQSLSDRITQQAQKHEELSDVAQAMKNKVKQSSGVQGALTGVLPTELVLHGIGASHPVAAALSLGYKGYKLLNNPYELGSKLNSTVNTFKALGNIANGVSKKIASGSRAIFSSNPVRGAIVSEAANESYDKRVERIQELASNTDSLVDNMTKNTQALYDSAPNISGGIHSTMINAVNYLNSKIPRPANPMFGSDDFEPSESQRDQFNGVYNVVNDPISVLNQVREGSLSNDQLAAVQTVYPHLMDEMRKTVMEQMTPEKVKEMTYSSKMVLAKFLGQPLDESMTPTALLSNQAVLQGPQQSSQGMTKTPKGRPKTTLGGLKELDLASRSATGTQDLEADDDA